MWSKSDPEDPVVARMATGSEVVVMSDMPPPEMLARTVPSVASMNITKSSRVHIGPKFVSVTQNIDNAEMVKADPMPRYIWSIVKNTTRAERLSCAAAVVALLLCTGLIVYFTVVAKSDIEEVDRAPHEWYITPEMWLSKNSTGNSTVEEYSPLKLVIIQHTVSPECHRFTICAAELRNLQNYYLNSPNLGYDLAYNFAIGNDGRVYEIRGWNREGAHTKGYNRCSVGIGFIGDYREDNYVHTRVTDLQLKRLTMLLERGVELGFLRPDYTILGAKDVTATISPGENLYRALQTLEHYNDPISYKGRNCDEIHEMVNG